MRPIIFKFAETHNARKLGVGPSFQGSLPPRGAGTAAATVDGTGALVAAEATLAGVGVTLSAGSGALAATAATVAGAGVSLSLGTAALQAQAAAAAGAGVSSSTSTGALASQASAANGTGISRSTGSGALAAQAASAAGAGVTASTGTGALGAQSSAVAGSGVSESRGVAALVAVAAAVSGDNAPAVGFGDLMPFFADLDGSGEVTGEAEVINAAPGSFGRAPQAPQPPRLQLVASGNLQAQRAVVRGAGGVSWDDHNELALLLIAA